MHETANDFSRLEALIDRSIDRAGPFLRSSFQMPERSLSARQLCDHLQGLVTVALATVTARNAPRVAPIGAVFYRGAFCIPTIKSAARTRMLQANPAASLAYYEGNDLAVIVHGRAEVLEPDPPEFSALDSLLDEVGGQSPTRWGEGVFLRLKADRLFSYFSAG